MVEPLKQINLRKDGVFEVLIVGEGGQVDLLDGHLLLALTLYPLVDLAVHSLAQALRGLVRIVADHLYHHFCHLFTNQTQPNTQCL